MDATQLFRDRVQSLLVRGLASPEVTAVLGIEGVSEVWDATAPLDRPAWYLWLREAPGAYRVGLEEASRSDASTSPLARFSIRYYPAPGEPAFAAFSTEERAFVQRGFMDATGTPRAERAREIPDDLFNVGVLEYRLHAERPDAELAFVSMDRLRVRYEEDAALRYEPLGTVISHSCGELARDVPGWRLGAPVFRCVAGLHAYLTRRPPSAVAVEKHPGTEFVRRGGAFECLATDAAVLGEALAIFGASCDGAAAAPAAAPDELPLELGREWWAVAAAPQRMDALPCGCGCAARASDHSSSSRATSIQARAAAGR